MNENVLEFHSLTHTKPRTIKSNNIKTEPGVEKENSKCKLCYKNFNHRANFGRHIKNVHKQDTKYFAKEISDKDLIHNCDLCSLKFVTKHASLVHMKNSHPYFDQVDVKFEILFGEDGKVNGKVKCKICSRTLKRKYKNKHVVAFHSGRKIRSIRGKSHSVVENVKFKCKLCYKSFSNSKKITKHIQIVHKTDSEFFRRFQKCDF